MRKSIYFIALLIALMSCQSHLVIREIQFENISNEPDLFLPDSGVISMVKPYHDALQGDMARVISISIDEMYKQKPESKLTNYLADLLLEEGISYCKKNGFSFVPQASYYNYGGIRSSLPKGEINVGHIFELMPFENEMVILELSGADMIAFANRVAEHGGDGVSGVKIGIKDGVVSHFDLNGKDILPQASYILVTNDYVAAGGDGMKMFENRKKYVKTGLNIRDIIIGKMERDYKNGIKVDASKDGRIYYE